MPRIITIDRGDVGTRIDRVLWRHLQGNAGISRTKIQQLVTAGAVLVNGRRAPRASWRVAAGDDIRVEFPESQPRAMPRAEPLPLSILYEDHSILIVDKPAGMVVHPAFRNAHGTLINALLHHASGWLPPGRPTLVLRLDKDTSGIVLVAKSSAVHAALQRAMRRTEIEKDYLAVVFGKPVPASGTIDLALDRDPWDRRRVMVHDRAGQPSVTRYKRLKTWPSGISLVQCRLITGRTHQIRVHLAAKGWPIVGDALYGRRDPRIARQALHAWTIAFDHPITGARVTATAPIPPDIQRLLDTLSTPAISEITVPSAE